MVRSFGLILLCCLGTAVHADQVVVSGGVVAISRDDCARRIQHHPGPGVAYQSGMDVHGKPVAPADLDGNERLNLIPDKLQFDVRINPMNYAQGQKAAIPSTPASPSAGTTGATVTPQMQQGMYANTSMPVAHVEVDPKTGVTMLNDKPLTAAQDKALLDACGKAGFR